MIDFAGKRVVVTGAAGGVGRALVDTLRGCNASVVACDRDAMAFDDDRVSSVRFDLLDEKAVDAAVARICDEEAPAAVISNAGWTRAETLDDVTSAALTEEIDLNLKSAARLSQAFLPAMRDQPGGSAFVFISSINALAHFGNPAYAAAKAGLIAWMRALATEEGRHGIRANAVAPGSIRTAAWDHRIERDPDIMEKVGRLYPLGRLVVPEEVARAAAFLASPPASGITGTTLPVDAGVTAGNLPFLQQIAN